MKILLTYLAIAAAADALIFLFCGFSLGALVLLGLGALAGVGFFVRDLLLKIGLL